MENTDYGIEDSSSMINIDINKKINVTNNECMNELINLYQQMGTHIGMHHSLETLLETAEKQVVVHKQNLQMCKFAMVETHRKIQSLKSKLCAQNPDISIIDVTEKVRATEELGQSATESKTNTSIKESSYEKFGGWCSEKGTWCGVLTCEAPECDTMSSLILADDASQREARGQQAGAAWSMISARQYRNQ